MGILSSALCRRRIRRFLQVGLIANIAILAIYFWNRSIFSVHAPALQGPTENIVDLRAASPPESVKQNVDSSQRDRGTRMDNGEGVPSDLKQKDTKNLKRIDSNQSQNGTQSKSNSQETEQRKDSADIPNLEHPSSDKQKSVDTGKEGEEGTENGTGSRRGGEGRVSARLLSAFKTDFTCSDTVNLRFLGLDSYTVTLDQDPACPWISKIERNPENNFVAFGREMALVHNVTLNPAKFKGAKGGENIESVIDQKEGAEYFDLSPGAFRLRCATPPKVKFKVGIANYRRHNHMDAWLQNMECTGQEVTPTNSSQAGRFISGVTLAVTRYEYANAHHCLSDWYNAYLALLILGIDPRHTTVLLVDGHPVGKFDEPWATIFGNREVLRVGHLPSLTTFEYMVWVPVGYHSPIFMVEYQKVPYLEEMRQFFFKKYGVQPKAPEMCPSLHILFILRRDYLAHPRNPSGKVARKIANEQEIVQTLKNAGHVVHGVQMDLFPVSKQLEEAGQANLMLGMHGAGLTWSIVLKRGSGLLEIAPSYFQQHSQCFRAISKWRGLHHIHWANTNSSNEKAEWYTYLPPKVILGMVTELRDKICNGTRSAS